MMSYDIPPSPSLLSDDGEHEAHHHCSRQAKRTSELLRDYEDYIARIEGQKEVPDEVHMEQSEMEVGLSTRYRATMNQCCEHNVGDLHQSIASRNKQLKMDFDSVKSILGTSQEANDMPDIVDDKARIEHLLWENDMKMQVIINASPRSKRYGKSLGMLAKCTIGSIVVLATTLGVAAPVMSRFHRAKDEPHWFDRSVWIGQTYDEAVEFCKSKNNQELCAYDEICPYGPGGRALGIGEGFTEDPHGLAWVPAKDEHNAWVHVGAKNHCLPYKYVHGQAPSWGLNGRDNEEITRHILCCPSHSYEEDQDEAILAADNAAIKLGEDLEDLDPLLYDRSDGWMGTTFNEALEFCKTKATTEDEDEEGHTRFPCPYETYCPLGPHHPPTIGRPGTKGLSYGDDVYAWSPILDEVGHGVLQVGGQSENEDGVDTACTVRYLSQEVGKEDLEVKMEFESLVTHVMCCRLV